ncbi:hypothetical protein BU14_0082s0036 [Porphyra umbilicalis]|uniref:Secreted protein n=1 Tax=Porphyra umbilicalis TaxID=2786 RepID=A0A1X6PEI5_PORUM|nr:hypothetical protein BU14_0082s0036 [Porphyra umbilicalis]|eukprot:OSX79271.1 hypothetical protein BU14_0082s0036 [Porphyra umbilicalis]
MLAWLWIGAASVEAPAVAAACAFDAGRLSPSHVRGHVPGGQLASPPMTHPFAIGGARTVAYGWGCSRAGSVDAGWGGSPATARCYCQTEGIGTTEGRELAVPSAGRSHRGLLAVAGLCSLFAGRSMPRHRHPWPAHIQPPHAAPVAPLDACRLLSSDVEAAALRSTDGGGAGGEHMPTRSNGEGVCGRCCAARSFFVSLISGQLCTYGYVHSPWRCCEYPLLYPKDDPLTETIVYARAGAL